MDKYHHIWQDWAHRLHQWGLQEWIASLLEAAGPMTILGGQAVYILQPVVAHIFPPDHVSALAAMLAEPSQSRAFTEYLREDRSR